MLRSEPRLRRKIPLGVRILAILNLIFGFAALLNVIIYLFIGGGYTSVFSLSDSSTETIIVDTLVAILCLVVGFGFYSAMRWSWTLAIVLYSINMGAIIFRTVMGLDSVGELVRLAIPAIVIYYLFMSHVREYFGKSRKVVIEA